MLKQMIFTMNWFGDYSSNLFRVFKNEDFCIICIISFFLFGCNSDATYNSSLEFNSEEILLMENLKPISPISSFDVLNDESVIVITEGREVIRYSNKGEQIKILDNFGQAEFQMYTPSIVQAYNEGYVIWDEALLKMIEFDNYDQPIAEYNGFDHAIKDFKVDENYFYTYINPLPNKPYIQIFSKQTEVLVIEIGVATDSDIIGSLNTCGGGITIVDEDLFFVASSSLDVFQMNRDRFNDIKVALLEDKAIEFKKFEEDVVDIINNNISKAIEMSMSSSIVTGIHKIDQNILIIGETGETEFIGRDIDLSRRKVFLLLFNMDFDLKAKSFLEYDINSSCKLWVDSNESLYRIIRKEGKDDFDYYLNKIILLP